MQSYLLVKHINFREVQDRVVKSLLGRIIGVWKDRIIKADKLLLVSQQLITIDQFKWMQIVSKSD